MIPIARRPAAPFLLLLASLAAACGETGTGPIPRSYPPDRSFTGVRLVGPTRALVILTQYADSPVPKFSRSAIANYLFGSSQDGKISRLFLEASEGAFELTGDVAGPVKTSVLTGTFGLPGVLGPNRETDHIIEAIRGVDGGLDFGRYDNDGPDGIPNSGDDDGLVDGGISILHTEIDSHCGDGGVGRGPHPHTLPQWGLPPDNHPYRTEDDAFAGGKIGIDGFTIMSSMDCSGQQIGHAVLAHELGHILLGLPDIYHSVLPGTPIWTTRRWVLGCWELMASGGSWGCGRGTPSHERAASSFSAWSRIQTKWAVPIEGRIDRDTVYELRPIGRGGTILRLPVADREYFLVEYREPLGTDLGLPGAGVLIYRVRDDLPTFPGIGPDSPREYKVMLVEADANAGLTRTDGEGGDRGVVADAFNGLQNSFIPGVHPGARSAAGVPLPYKLTEISVDLAAHRARVRVSPHTGG